MLALRSVLAAPTLRLKPNAELNDASVLRLYYRIGIVAQAQAPAADPIDALLRVFLLRVRIARDWIGAYATATWTPRQLQTVQGNLLHYGVGGDALRVDFARLLCPACFR